MQFISTWVNLKDYMEVASGLGVVGLRDSMKALEISEQISPRKERQRPNCGGKHNAGNDAVRKLAVLAALLGRASLLVKGPIRKVAVTRTVNLKLFHHCPSTYKSYPFTVKLRLSTAVLYHWN
jgi:hypothetical protein